MILHHILDDFFFNLFYSILQLQVYSYSVAYGQNWPNINYYYSAQGRMFAEALAPRAFAHNTKHKWFMFFSV